MKEASMLLFTTTYLSWIVNNQLYKLRLFVLLFHSTEVKVSLNMGNWVIFNLNLKLVKINLFGRWLIKFKNEIW